MTVWLARDESAAEPPLPEGMLRNGSFEKATGRSPAGWERRTYGGQARLRLARDGHTGQRCAMISSEAGADAGWFASARVKPYSRYRLSGWVKTENLKAGSGRGAQLNLHNIQSVRTEAITGTNDWTQLDVEFDTGSNSTVELNCLFGGWGQSTGSA